MNTDRAKAIEDLISAGRYGWTISKDHTASPNDKPGTNMNAAGISGPSGVPLRLPARST